MTFIAESRSLSDYQDVGALSVAQDAGFAILREYRMPDEVTPPEHLKAIFQEDVLTTHQLVFPARHA